MYTVGNFLHTFVMKTFILTLTVIILSSLATLNTCAAIRQNGNRPEPDPDFFIRENKENPPRIMPKTSPDFRFEKN